MRAEASRYKTMHSQDVLSESASTKIWSTSEWKEPLYWVGSGLVFGAFGVVGIAFWATTNPDPSWSTDFALFPFSSCFLAVEIILILRGCGELGSQASH